ncbi:hypothetical protein TSAR_012727 [Trichomalopsis sarcophagae]|uniref:Uncharacterized protein n=1 Tax=Trichomalopsis sarcophagae TaxID=543379 RepID=A0A232EJX4_9HYME|nr:hypothetical protein TSAR_012727 [Trichomalopsis sarcophagae]
MVPLVGHKGANSQDIRYLSQRCADLTNAHNTAWQEAQVIQQRLLTHNERFADVVGQNRILEKKIENNRTELIKLIDSKTRSLGNPGNERMGSHVKIDLPIYSGAPFEQPIRFINSLFSKPFVASHPTRGNMYEIESEP